MQERGGSVGDATLNSWALKYNPRVGAAFRRGKRSMWLNWRLDESSWRTGWRSTANSSHVCPKGIRCTTPSQRFIQRSARSKGACVVNMTATRSCVCRRSTCWPIVKPTAAKRWRSCWESPVTRSAAGWPGMPWETWLALLFFVAAAMVSAWAGRWDPGVLAVVLSTPVLRYFLLRPSPPPPRTRRTSSG